ncbi:MAG: ABC transporter ATP-binding protein [Desulfovibrionaceae bacterium]|nr:ABC transporter ATP-binding protein [Desulfovibrionaceae bacterium]
MSPGMSGHLACAGLHAGYRGRRVLGPVDLCLRPGELSVVIGPNGEGKTTLLRCLAGVLRPTAGQALLNGRALDTLTPRERARRVAVLPQRPGTAEALGLAAEDAVLLGRYARLTRFGVFTHADYQAARNALKAVSALSLARRPLGELSGGERQRVFLARALAQEADILLLDEPADALDPAHQAALFTLLKSLTRAGATVLAVLHDINAAVLYADRVLALRNGRILFDVCPAKITSDHLEALYDTPFCTMRHPVLPLPQFCPVPAGA